VGEGDATAELRFEAASGCNRIFEGGLWFIVAGLICLLTTLPLLAERRDPYPWGACSVAWLIAAGFASAGAVVVNRRKGMVFDRRKGVVILWTALFGRRRERRFPLNAYTTFVVKTSTGTGRAGNRFRWYALQLRGPRGSLALSDIAALDQKRAASSLAGFLGLPRVIEDRNPGEEPPVGL